MERLCILGSTGSIGRQTLDVVRSNPGRFSVVSLAAGNNIKLLAEQIKEFAPQRVVTGSESAAADLRASGFSMVTSGRKETETIAADTTPGAGPDIVVGAIVGFEGLYPVLAAAKSGKRIALANKECLVAAGSIVLAEAKKNGAELVPVDSEHGSIYQCLDRRGKKEPIRRIIITASGGPFLSTPLEALADIRPEQALKHPTWSMGAKISVDSATLMNKGLEVIEASVLFDLPPEKVEVLIHTESLVHGLVEYSEGTVLTAMFTTDMRVPIAYALGALSPEREGIASGVNWLDLAGRTLHFAAPDARRFPALGLCYQALRSGGTSPAVLNAANETAVESFLRSEIGFLDIIAVVQEAVERVPRTNVEGIEDVVTADAEARVTASKIIARIREKKRQQ